MAKKRKIGRNEAHNALKTLEATWLRDRRLQEVQPIEAKVIAAKAAALLEYVEENQLPVEVNQWPLGGVEDLVRFDETGFKQALVDLQRVGVLNDNLKLRKVVSVRRARGKVNLRSESGVLHYRCAKPGGVNITDRDEYVAEDQEVAYTEEEIGESPNLQMAIANEWLVRVDGPKTTAEKASSQ
ncbi:MAG: hypothetical protein NTW87_27520 [Planctomycetota bacterium]|nr:hypothetical protein [Planctomycetota bacterium]